MSIFSKIGKKNPNETAFTGGEKHWTDVIKNTGAGDLMIWRQPEEDFNTNSTLIVMPGEAAIFIKGGQIEQVFEKGTYTLSTENYPFISRLRNAFSGGISTFNCVVYYVRRAVSKELLWGTPNRIQVRDKLWEIRTDFGARGSFKVSVDEPGVFLQKMVGNNIPYQTVDEVFDYFGEELQSKIISTLSGFMNEWPGELIGMEAHLQDLSKTLLPAVDEMLKEYGLKCVSFAVSGLDIETTKYDIIDESQIELIARKRQALADKITKLTNAEADAGTFALLGDNWAKLHAAGILQTLAENPATGGVASQMGGFGMGMATMGVFSGLADQMFSPFTGNGAQPAAGTYVPTGTGNYIQEGVATGTAAPASPGGKEDPEVILLKMKRLLEKGLISQSQYDEKVKEVLDRM